jgi:hypothetical protein
MQHLAGNFIPPRTYDFDLFKAAVLSPLFADQDFAAVRASADSIRNVFGPTNGWPDSHISYAENLADLVRHEQEFSDRVAFAYALFDPSGELYLGCLYIKPVKSKVAHDRRRQLFQAQAFFWLSTTHTILNAQDVLPVLQTWLSDYWSLALVAWPGRVQAWAEWEALAGI